jgi:hypothetical protein
MIVLIQSSYLIYSLGTSNVLLLDINVMKNLPIDFDGIHQLSTGKKKHFEKSLI